MGTINAKAIERTIRSKSPTSLTALYHALGGEGTLDKETRAKITEAMPSVVEELQRVKQLTQKRERQALKPKRTAKRRKSQWLKGYHTHSEENPYGHKGSSYSAIWDSVNRYPGRTKAWHISRLAPLTGKSPLKLGYDFNVVIGTALDKASRKRVGMSLTTKRHRSCKTGYSAGASLKGGEKVYQIN